MANGVFRNFEKEVYQKYYPLVFSNCRRRLVDSHTIEDAVQSTFLIYIREEASINSSLSSWLYWTSTNVCKVINKDKKREKSFSNQNLQNQSEENNGRGPQESEIEDHLKDILEKLPKKKQEMILMRFFDNMSYRQIALHFKGSEDGVRKMIEHTLDHLKKSLNKKDIVFSVLFLDFFNRKIDSEIVSTAISGQIKKFIMQNSVEQQVIIKAVQKTILFGKIKMVMLVVASALIPISALVIASNNDNNLAADNNKVASKIEAKSLPVIIDPKDKLNASKANKNVTATIENSFLGLWKLKAKTANYPHQIGSELTINKDGTFTLTQPNANGSYFVKDNVFTFDFSRQMIFTFNFKNDDKNLSFDLKDAKGGMTMEYIR